MSVAADEAASNAEALGDAGKRCFSSGWGFWEAQGPRHSQEAGGVAVVPEPVWVREDVVQAIHWRQLSEHGGEPGVRDEGLISSALARPKNVLAYRGPKAGLPALAAAYAFGISRNHPFVDGNKRTAYVVFRTFLKLNGCDIGASREEKYLTFLKLAEGKVTEDEMATWIRDHVVAR